MAYVDTQERVRLGIERQFVVSVNAYYELVDVKLRWRLLKMSVLPTNRTMKEGDFLLCDLVEQAVVHVAHDVPFFYECVSVVSVEGSTRRVRQPI